MCKYKKERCRDLSRRKIEIRDEEIYELREQGMTHKEIARYYNEKGIEISKATIAYRCKKIYNEKGKDEPKIKRKNMVKEATDEEIYELREQGKSYEEIARYYKEKGIEITRVAIGKRCKKIYNEKGKEAPKIKKGKNKREDVTDEEIYELREQGMSYKGMMEYFEQKDVKISKSLLSKRLKEIYNEKGKEEPKIKKGKNKREDVTDEEIYELREQGISYREMERHFDEKGIKISQMALYIRCKKIYKEKGEEEPKAKRGRKKNNNTKLLGNLNNTLNEKIKEKIGTEKELAELKYKEKNSGRGKYN